MDYHKKSIHVKKTENLQTFFSFWISDATPAIPTKDFELVKWTLRTLARTVTRYQEASNGFNIYIKYAC